MARCRALPLTPALSLKGRGDSFLHRLLAARNSGAALSTSVLEGRRRAVPTAALGSGRRRESFARCRALPLTLALSLAVGVGRHSSAGGEGILGWRAFARGTRGWYAFAYHDDHSVGRMIVSGA